MPRDERFRRAKSRDWTNEEVTDAAEFVRSQRPDVWAKLLEVERTTGDYHDVEEKAIEWRLLRQIHPECELNEMTDLFIKLREMRISIVNKKGA